MPNWKKPVLRACEICGKEELMTPRSYYCEECKKAETIKRQKEAYERYYSKNREKIIQKQLERNAKPKKEYAPQEIKRRYAVQYIQKDGGVCWQVRFKNPKTERTVLWSSEGVFKDLRAAQRDFSKACGG